MRALSTIRLVSLKRMIPCCSVQLRDRWFGFQRNKLSLSSEYCIWNQPSFTKGHEKHSSLTGLFRGSLNRLDENDDSSRKRPFCSQVMTARNIPSKRPNIKMAPCNGASVCEGEVTVSVPSETKNDIALRLKTKSQFGSIKMQALVAQIGEKMGFKIRSRCNGIV